MAATWGWATSEGCTNPMATTMAVGGAVIASGHLAAGLALVAEDGGAAATRALGMARLPYPGVPMAAAVGLMVGAGTTSRGCAFPNDSAGWVSKPRIYGMRILR